MHLGAAEALVVALLAGRHLHERRTTEEHLRALLDHHDVVAHARHVGAARGGVAEHDRDRRDRRARQAGDVAERLAAGDEDLALVGRSAPPDSTRWSSGRRFSWAICIARSALRDGHVVFVPPRTVGSLAMIMHSTPSIDADAGDHAGADREVGAPRGERRQLEQRRVVVEEQLDALAASSLPRSRWRSTYLSPPPLLTSSSWRRARRAARAGGRGWPGTPPSARRRDPPAPSRPLTVGQPRRDPASTRDPSRFRCIGSCGRSRTKHSDARNTRMAYPRVDVDRRGRRAPGRAAVQPPAHLAAARFVVRDGDGTPVPAVPLPTEPPKPGLVRVVDGEAGAGAIEVEVWELDAGGVRARSSTRSRHRSCIGRSCSTTAPTSPGSCASRIAAPPGAGDHGVRGLAGVPGSARGQADEHVVAATPGRSA